MKNIIGFIIGLVLLTGCQKEEVQPPKWWVGDYRIEIPNTTHSHTIHISETETVSKSDGEISVNDGYATIIHSDDSYIISKYEKIENYIDSDSVSHIMIQRNTYKVTRDMRLYGEDYLYFDGVQISGVGINSVPVWRNLQRL